jgi:hypothetical protein
MVRVKLNVCTSWKYAKIFTSIAAVSWLIVMRKLQQLSEVVKSELVKAALVRLAEIGITDTLSLPMLLIFSPLRIGERNA